jgi:nucleoid DNA-binding protein
MMTPELIDAVPDPEIIGQVFDAVATVLLKKRRVEVHGFGVFELVIRKARKARNPRTGARIDLPAKTVVRFKPAWTLRERAEAVPLPPSV